MKIKPLVFTTILIFLAFCNVANALTLEDKKQIDEQMQILKSNLENGNMSKFVWQLPPKVLNELAKEQNLTALQLEAKMAVFTKPIVEQVKFQNFSYQLAKGIEGKAPQHHYIIFPVTMDLVTKFRKLHLTENVLAMTEIDQWYIMRLESPKSLNIVRKVYPDLKDLTFPSEIK